jgi:hypothetical protein
MTELAMQGLCDRAEIRSISFYSHFFAKITISPNHVVASALSSREINLVHQFQLTVPVEIITGRAPLYYLMRVQVEFPTVLSCDRQSKLSE